MLGQVIWKRAIGATDPSSNPVTEIGIRFLRPLPSPWKMNSEPEFPSDSLGEEEIPELPPFQQP
jgi:hypothetical protein